MMYHVVANSLSLFSYDIAVGTDRYHLSGGSSWAALYHLLKNPGLCLFVCLLVLCH